MIKPFFLRLLYVVTTLWRTFQISNNMEGGIIHQDQILLPQEITLIYASFKCTLPDLELSKTLESTIGLEGITIVIISEQTQRILSCMMSGKSHSPSLIKSSFFFLLIHTKKNVGFALVEFLFPQLPQFELFYFIFLSFSGGSHTISFGVTHQKLTRVMQ